MMTPAFSARAGKLLLAAIGLYALAVFAYQVSLMANPDFLHEEMRLLFRYHLVADPQLFAGDYITSFATAFSQPYLYDWLSRAWLGAGGDLIVLHRVIPLIAWLGFLAGLGVAARRLGDSLTLVAVLGIAVAQPVYLHQITSALPHSFAFPLLVWAFVAQLYGSAAGLALVTLLSGLLYPAIAPLVGMLFAWHVVITGRVWRRRSAGAVRDVVLLAVTGGLSFWLLLDILKAPMEFGAALAPLERLDLYPENGPEGRHFYGIFNPFTYVAAKAFDQFHDVFGRFKLLLLLVYGLFSLYGFAVLCRARQGGQAVLALVACSLALSVLVLAVKPFLVYRFALYPGFTILPLLFVRGVETFCQRFDHRLRFARPLALAIALLFTLALDGVDAKKLGYWWQMEPEGAAIVAFAAEQPADSLFAAWPQREGGLEFLPYLARRPLFVMQKAHYPTYEGHLLEMRRRMEALIEAYLATDAAALRALYCRWGVDYLVADKRHFAEPGERPDYFAPFDGQIEALWQERRGSDFFLAAPDPDLIALETERYLVVRLSGPCQAD